MFKFLSVVWFGLACMSVFNNRPFEETVVCYIVSELFSIRSMLEKLESNKVESKNDQEVKNS